MSNHNNGFKIGCNYCAWSGGTVTQLRSHCARYHPQQQQRWTTEKKQRKNQGWKCVHDDCTHVAPSRAKLREHEKAMHKTCNECNRVFLTVPQLKNHVENVHKKVIMHQCPLCNEQFESKWLLKEHQRNQHAKYVCPYCALGNNKFMTEADFNRHNAIVHKPENQCSFCGQGFSCSNKLHQHIISTHYDYPCYYCGAGYPTQKQLYEHQTKHCFKSFKCKHCEESFDDLISCQRHEMRQHGKFGISLEATPTVRSIHMFTNYLKHEAQPWINDVDNTISKQPYYFDSVMRVVNQTKRTLQGRGVDTENLDMNNHIIRHSVRSVRTSTIEGIKKAYLDHASEMMTHSQRSEDRDMLTYNIHLLSKIPFEEQIEEILNSIYTENEHNLPYKISLMFAFMLFTPSTGRVGYWHANSHLSHDRRENDRDLLQQRDNVWNITSQADMTKCISDVQNNDFFTLMRNALDDSNSVILRCTNVRIQIFPTADNAIGRGRNVDHDEDDEEEDGDDDDEIMDDDYDDCDDDDYRRDNIIEEQEEQLEVNDDDGDENSRDVMMLDNNEEMDEGERSKEIIKNFLHRKSNKKYIWSNKGIRSNHRKIIDTKCFFHCIAVQELIYEGNHGINEFFSVNRNEEIKEKSNELFELYAKTFNLSSVDKTLFNGVHFKLIPQLEHLYGYRVNVYTIDTIYDPELKTSKIHFDMAAMSKTRFVYNARKRMDLIFFDNHYYLLLDKDAILNNRFMCFKCGIEFGKLTNLQRHTRESCLLLKPKEQYASGAVASSQLLLERMKSLFSIPDDILKPLEYSHEETEKGMLTREGNESYFTNKFATYDFESKLCKTTMEEIRQRRLNYMQELYGNENDGVIEEFTIAEEMEQEAIDHYINESLVYDDEGNQVTGREFIELYGNEDYILENIPISYVVAYNFGTNQVEECNFIENNQSSTYRCNVIDNQVAVTRSNENPKELISAFYNDLKEISMVYRKENLTDYEDLIGYLKEWFDERGLILNIDLPTDDIWNNDNIIFDDDDELMNNNLKTNRMEIVYPKEDDTTDGDGHPSPDGAITLNINELAFDGKTMVKSLSEEIKLMRDFKRFLEMLVVVGYNSGKYDIPLIKPYLFHEIFVVDGHPTDSNHFHMIKKGSSYIGIQVINMTTPGCFGFMLKDMREFTGPGGNLRSFMKAFKNDDDEQDDHHQDDLDPDEEKIKGKFFWPYEWLTSYQQLFTTTSIPPYDAFWSRLKDENVLEEEINDYVKKKNLFHLSKEELMQRCDRPMSGEEYYELIKRTWTRKGWQNMLDYLLFYNEMDVRPFLKSISVYLKALFQHKVNPLFSCYSLPGVAKKILSTYMPPGTIYHIDNEDVFKLLRKAEVGGQSIVMMRENPETHPYIVGYDACSLYLSSFAKNHFIGRPTLYTKFDESCPLLKNNELEPTNKWNKRKKDSIQRRRRQSSKIANEYFDTIQAVDYPEKLIVREWRFALSAKEKKYVKQRYEELGIGLNAPNSFLVDGFLQDERTIFEFDGCFYHACEKTDFCRKMTNGNKYSRYIRKKKDGSGKIIFEKVNLTSEQIRSLDKIRDEVLSSSSRGYRIRRVKECDWNLIKASNSKYKECIQKFQDYESKMIMWNDNHSLVTVNFTLNQILKGEVDGIVFVDIYTPDELKERYRQFAPIIKHAVVKMKDIGWYMQGVAAKLDVKFPEGGRRMVIDSYFGENVGMTCESIRQLVSMGLNVTDIHSFIRYESFPIFKPFVDRITRLRMQGDTDPSKAIIATMAKLLGNSAFGSCITNVEKHREIKMVVTQPRGRPGGPGRTKRQLMRELASRQKFKGYEVVNPNVLEVSNEKDVILYTQLRQISNVIFDGSKNTMRIFIDFCFSVLEKGSYYFMSTDTDSIYIAFKNGPKFEDNVDPNKWTYYQQEKHKYFVTPTAKYGERTPGLFKIEATGTNMVALCAKSYVVYNEDANGCIENDKVKFSCKGVQKGEMYKLADRLRQQEREDHDDDDDDDDDHGGTYKSIFKIYQDDLHKGQTHMITNRGMKRTNDVFTNYEQEKKCSTSFYCKRLVLDDGIHTIPLNI